MHPRTMSDGLEARGFGMLRTEAVKDLFTITNLEQLAEAYLGAMNAMTEVSILPK